MGHPSLPAFSQMRGLEPGKDGGSRAIPAQVTKQHIDVLLFVARSYGIAEG
jgi:hypothetical protein